MGASTSENSGVGDVAPPNGISCAACGQTDGDLLQCSCEACKSLRVIPYCIATTMVCQESNEQEHTESFEFIHQYGA